MLETLEINSTRKKKVTGNVAVTQDGRQRRGNKEKQLSEAKKSVIRGGLVEVVNFEATTMLLQLPTCLCTH